MDGKYQVGVELITLELKQDLNGNLDTQKQSNTGSLEEEKDADFVIWDGPPLSIYSKVQETWIDGTRYWSVDENAQMEDRDKGLRESLIKKILNSTTPNTGKDVKPNSDKN